MMYLRGLGLSQYHPVPRRPRRPLPLHPRCTPPHNNHRKRPYRYRSRNRRCARTRLRLWMGWRGCLGGAMRGSVGGRYGVSIPKHSNGPTQPSSDPSPLPAAHTQQPFSPPPPPPLPHPPIPPQNTPPPARQQQGKSSSLEGAREVRIIMIRMCCARRAGDGSGRGM